MAVIAFLMDVEEGHLIPSLALALSLRAKGHEIVYISVADNEKTVREYGFGFYPIFEEHYPEGFQRRNKELIKQQGYRDAITEKHHFDSILTDSFTHIRDRIKPDLFIVSCFLCIEALILYYRFAIKPVLLTTFLRKKGVDTATACMGDILAMSADDAVKLMDLINRLGVKPDSLAELVSPLNSFCELILCPEELEIGPPLGKDNAFYLGPSIPPRPQRNEIKLPGLVPGGRTILYASLGSQAIIYGDACRKFFTTMLEVMARNDMKDLHLLLSIGAENKESELPQPTENVTILQWVPQTEILQRASLALVHGGLGTVKECIFFGVPMIVFPFSRDQPLNARRIEYHRLGMSLPIDRVSVEEVAAAIRLVLASDRIKENIGRMQAVFQAREKADAGVAIIQRLLDSTVPSVTM